MGTAPSAMAPRRLRAALCAAGAALHLGALGLVFPARSGAAEADLDGQLQEVRLLVREKRYPLALDGLRFVARQIQDLRVEEIRMLFPEPLAGWTASAPISLLDENEIWDARVEARRSYARADGGAKVEVTFDIHSPLIPAVSLGFNPLFVAGDPRARLIDLAAERGLLRFTPDTGEGELRVVVGREVLVTLAGRGLSSADTITDLARRIDYPALRTRASR